MRFILDELIDITARVGIDNNDMDKYKDILGHLSPISVEEYYKAQVLLPQEQPYYFKPGMIYEKNYNCNCIFFNLDMMQFNGLLYVFFFTIILLKLTIYCNYMG